MCYQTYHLKTIISLTDWRIRKGPFILSESLRRFLNVNKALDFQGSVFWSNVPSAFAFSLCKWALNFRSWLFSLSIEIYLFLCQVHLIRQTLTSHKRVLPNWDFLIKFDMICVIASDCKTSHNLWCTYNHTNDWHAGQEIQRSKFLLELLTCKLTLTRSFESRNLICQSCILLSQCSASVVKEQYTINQLVKEWTTHTASPKIVICYWVQRPC